MRWVWATLGLVALAGLASAAAGPVRSLFGESEAAPLPTLVARRDTLVESAVALGTLRPQVGA